MSIISDISEACGNLPHWFLSLAIILATSAMIITILDLDKRIATIVLGVTICILAIYEGSRAKQS